MRSDTSQQLENLDEFYYVGYLYIGGLFEEIKVLWDTSSDLLMVESYLCDTCTSDFVYDYQDEAQMDDSFTPMPDSSSTFTVDSSSITVSGFYATDSICLEEYVVDTCTDDFTLFMVTEQEGILSDASAVVGLKPNTGGL